MLNQYKILSILILLQCKLQSIDATTLDEVLAARESDVKKVAALAESLYAARCSAPCTQCTKHFCSNLGLDQTCQTILVKQACKSNCPDNGELVNTQASAIQTPLDINYLSDAQGNIVCGLSGNGTGSMDSLFTNLYLESIGDMASMFVGFNEGGIFKRFPAASLDCTVNYDPRTRPWYVAGSSGAKNVILVLDKSGSMRTNDRIGIAKQAASIVLDTLTIADWFGIVIFDSTASQYASDLKRATAAEIANAKKYINAIVEGGGTEFFPPLQMAYNLFNANHQDTYGTACQSMILFMTDGQVSDTSGTDELLTSNIAAWDQDKQVAIFAYSVGSDADDVIPKHLSCLTKGVWTKIMDSDLSSLRTDMSQYYTFIASGLEITQVAWTEPYASTFGVGQMVSAAYPIYDRSTSPASLVGVAGVTILVSSLSKYEGNADVILRKLITRSQTCFTNKLKTCELENLRLTDQQKCGGNCPVQTSHQICVPKGNAICGLIIGSAKAAQDTCCGDCLGYKDYKDANRLKMSILFICLLVFRLQFADLF